MIPSTPAVCRHAQDITSPGNRTGAPQVHRPPSLQPFRLGSSRAKSHEQLRRELLALAEEQAELLRKEARHDH